MKNLLWIKSVIQKKSWYVWLILVIQIVLNVGGVLYAIVFKKITDAAAGGSWLLFRNWVLTFLFLVVIQTTLGACNRFATEWARASIENGFKEKLYSSILHKKYVYITGTHSGEWLNRFTSDNVVVADGVVQIFPGIISMLVKMGCAVVLLIYFCPVFGYLIIPASVLFVLLSAGFRTVLKRRHTDVQEADGELRSFFQESMSELLVVKAFSKEGLMETYAKERMETHKKARVRKNYFSNFCNTGFVAVMNAAYVTGTALGGYGILTGRMSYGTLIAIVQLIGQIQSPLSGLTGYIPQIYSMFASVERLQKIETYDNDVETESMKSPGEIQQIYRECFEGIVFEDVSFSYPRLEGNGLSEQERQAVFIQLNLRIEKGDCVALTGHSGCGKSTFLKLLMELYSPDSGEIAVMLKGNKETLTSSWRHLYAYVPQENLLMSGSIREIVSFGETNPKTDENVWKALRIAAADSFVRKLPEQLDTILGERGAGISEGQMQRIAIARAIYDEAPILLLDEATSALDEETEKQVLQNIHGLTDKTVLIVTHRKAVLDVCNVELRFDDNESNIQAVIREDRTYDETGRADCSE